MDTARRLATAPTNTSERVPAAPCARRAVINRQAASVPAMKPDAYQHIGSQVVREKGQRQAAADRQAFSKVTRARRLRRANAAG